MEYFVPAEGLKDEPDPIEEVENLEDVELRREVLPYGVRPRPYVPVPEINYKLTINIIIKIILTSLDMGGGQTFPRFLK